MSNEAQTITVNLTEIVVGVARRVFRYPQADPRLVKTHLHNYGIVDLAGHDFSNTTPDFRKTQCGPDKPIGLSVCLL